MRIIVAILFVAVICLMVLALATVIQRWRVSRQPWELQESSVGRMLSVWAVKPGSKEKTLLGTVLWDDPEFDFRIEEIRSEARHKIIAANSGNPKALSA
jgi:hypothetical protein